MTTRVTVRVKVGVRVRVRTCIPHREVGSVEDLDIFVFGSVLGAVTLRFEFELGSRSGSRLGSGLVLWLELGLELGLGLVRVW